MEANEDFFRILKIMTQYRNFVSISTLYSKLFRKEFKKFEIYSIRNLSTKASSSKFRKFKLLQIFRIKKKNSIETDYRSFRGLCFTRRGRGLIARSATRSHKGYGSDTPTGCILHTVLR